MIHSLTHSVRRKLIVLLTGVASISVLGASLVLCTYQVVRARAALFQENSTLAQVVAENSAAALMFDDRQTANETLGGLSQDSRITKACLYEKSGDIVGHFHPASGVAITCPPVAAAIPRFTLRHLSIRRPVMMAGDPVGLLYLEVSLSDMYSVLFRLLGVAGFTVVCASFFALLLSSLTERWISGPLLHLTEVALRISRTGDYGIRANRSSEDEVGLLIDQFNTMLERIREREQELRLASDVLEAKVQERTLDLRAEIAERKQIEQHLEQARITAEESNRAKSHFLANMSHELRTPLNAIIGYSEMVCEDAELAGEHGMTRDLKKVLSSAHHLLEVISDVLDFSKIEAGEMKLYPELVSVQGLLDDVLPTAEVLAAQKRNSLQATVLYSGYARVDALRFRQCLLNLISNACKFTLEGKISISVGTERRERQDWIVWAVQDTGPGISPADCNKLFKSFSQVDTSATRSYGGTGLGLAISQDLCQAMGGWIEVTSELGVGSVFRIVMPKPEKHLDPTLRVLDTVANPIFGK